MYVIGICALTVQYFLPIYILTCGTDIIHNDLRCTDAHTEVPGIGKEDTLFVAVLLSVIAAWVPLSRLGDELIHNSIQLLPGEEMIVPVENYVHA